MGILSRTFVKYRVSVEAETATEHPRVFTKFQIVHRYWGENLDTTKLERAIELSETTYCAVSAMLRASCPITTRYEVNAAEEAFASEEQ